MLDRNVHAGNGNRTAVTLRANSSEDFPDHLYPLVLVLAEFMAGLGVHVDCMNHLPLHTDVLVLGPELSVIKKVKAQWILLAERGLPETAI